MDGRGLIKFLVKRGGYPNPKILEILNVLDVEPSQFLNSLRNYLGDSEFKVFIKNSLKKLQTTDNYFRTYPFGEFQDNEFQSFVDLNFDKSEIFLEETYNVGIDYWAIGDSNLRIFIIDEVEPSIMTYDEALGDDFGGMDDYKGQFEMNFERALKSYLGFPISLGTRLVQSVRQEPLD